MGGEHRPGQVCIRLYFGILKAHDGEAGLPVVYPFLADQFQHLGGAALFVAAAVLEVLLGEVAVFIQRFTTGQQDFLPRMSGKGHLHIAGNVLAEIQHGFSVGGGEQPPGKRLPLPDGNRIHAGDGQGIAVGLYFVPAGKEPFQPGVIHFALL